MEGLRLSVSYFIILFLYYVVSLILEKKEQKDHFSFMLDSCY